MQQIIHPAQNSLQYLLSPRVIKSLLNIFVLICACRLMVAVVPVQADVAAQAGPPPLPASFYGQVLIEGEAPSPTSISAFIHDVQFAESPLISQAGQWVYALKIPADNPATADIEGGRAGDTVSFFAGDTAVATAVWQGGTNTQLDLTITGQTTIAQADNPTPIFGWLIGAALLILFSILFVLFVLWRRQQKRTGIP